MINLKPLSRVLITVCLCIAADMARAAAACPPPSLLWSREYNGAKNGYDYASAIAVDSQGNAVVVGSEMGVPNDDWIIRRYDANGDLSWSRSYTSPTTGNSSSDIPYDVAVDTRGDIIVVGSEMRGDIGQSWNWLIRKYDGAGNLLWSVGYDGAWHSDDCASAVAVNPARDIYVAGYEKLDTGGMRWLIRKYDADGYLVWSKSNPDSSPYNSWFCGVAIDSDGNIALAGLANVPNPSVGIGWLVAKFTRDGVNLWTKISSVIAYGMEVALSVAVDSGGNLIVAGGADREDIGQGVNWMVRKYDPAGNLVWELTDPGRGASSEIAYAVQVDRYDNVTVGGQENRNDLGQADNLLVRRYDRLGALQWSFAYNDPVNGDDEADDLAIGPDGSLFVAGTIDRSDQNQGANWLIMKYAAPPCPGQALATDLAVVRRLEQDVVIFPNPVVQDNVRIALRLKENASEVVIDVYNSALSRVFNGSWKNVRADEAVLFIEGTRDWAPGPYLVKARAKLVSGASQVFRAGKLVISR